MSLGKLASRKAELIENNIMKMRRAYWRQAIGAEQEEGSTAALRPTKAAYRYISQGEGWITSPLGKAMLNDQVEDEEG